VLRSVSLSTNIDTHAHSIAETLHHHDLQMCMCKDCQSTSLMCCSTSPWHHCSYNKLGQAIYITERRMSVRERDLEYEERESSGAGECRRSRRWCSRYEMQESQRLKK